MPGIPVKFTSSAGTTDPDRDELTYQWDFGDGTTSTEADPQKVYDTSAGNAVGDVTATIFQMTGHTPGSIGMVVPVKFRGATPTTVKAVALIVIV